MTALHASISGIRERIKKELEEQLRSAARNAAGRALTTWDDLALIHWTSYRACKSFCL